MLDITIECFSDPGYSSGKKAGTWKGSYAPNSLEVVSENHYQEQNSIGVSGPPIFYGEGEVDMTFPILIDNTHLAALPSPGTVKPVTKQVNALLKLVQEVNSESHTVNYLKITAGGFIFCGQTTSVTVNYSFFDPEGQPQRAEVKLSIAKAETIAKKKAKAGVKSPDLTRSVVVKEGDSLPGYSQKYYNTPFYYLELARFNGIRNVRQLKVGARLIIPPLES